MFNLNQKNLLIVILICVVVLGLFFFYFQTKLSKIENALISLQPEAVFQQQSQQEQEEQGQKTQPPAPNPPAVKTYTIAIAKDFLSPAGMTVNPEDKIEFKLKNNTEAEATFKANQDLGIDQDIILQPNQEKSLFFISPQQSGEYKFIITTSQGDLEGLLMVR